LDNLVAKVRKSKGMSGAFLAKEVGITRAWLYSVESGKGDPTIKLIRKIAKKLEKKASEIFFLD